MLQPLGWRLLAPGRSSLKWTSDVNVDRKAKYSGSLQQRRPDPIHTVLLPGRQWRLERQAYRVSNPRKIVHCAKLTRLSRYPDAYHSCYVLAGLSSTQYYNYFTADCGDTRSVDSLDSALRWTSSAISLGQESGKERFVDAEDVLEPLHPIFVIPWAAVEECRQLFRHKRGF